MNKKRRICAISGTRADFGLLTPLLKLIQNSQFLELQVMVTGMHLSPEFGSTYRCVEEEGFRIDGRVDMLLSADTDTAIVKSTGLGMIGFADALDRLDPDWVLVLGDRFEAFAAATTAYLKKIPIIHLHGGEVTMGATDEALRHSITKMSSLHFTASETYRNRVLQLGEPEECVFNVGAIGLDNIHNLAFMEREVLEEELNVDLSGPVLLVTYHPVTLEQCSSKQQMTQLLQALDELKDVTILFTFPNADSDGRVIIDLISKYVYEHSGTAKAFASLGQLRYLSLMKLATAVVGNSSSGIIEAPSFGIPTVNIGDRQKGRVAADSVVHTGTTQREISAAILHVLDPDFQKYCRTVENPYGTGGTSSKIMSVLNDRIWNIDLKKKFNDLMV